MKDKDSNNKAAKSNDVKNKDLIMLVDELKMLDFKNDRSFMAFSSNEEKGLTTSEMIQKYNEGKLSSYILDITELLIVFFISLAEVLYI